MALLGRSIFDETDADEASLGQSTGLYNLAELLKTRDKINNQIGDTTLKSLNLSDELVIQFQLVRSLLIDSASDNTIPLNQRAQAANSCTALLSQLAKMQEAVWNADRLKKMEGVVVDVFRKLDDEIGQEARLDLAARFLAAYKKALGTNV